MPDADGAILGASIRTLDDERPRATALAWRDGVLVAVGDDAEVREHIGPRTRVIDGRGMAVVPGLTDSHIHPFWGTRRHARGRPALRGDARRGPRAARRRARVRAGSGCSRTARTTSRSTTTGLRADAIAEAVGDRPR